MARELRREEVSLRLGVSVATVQRLEKEGVLTPRRDGRWLYFDAEQVARVKRTYRPRRTPREAVLRRLSQSNVRGKYIAKVFELLDSGIRDHRVIVRMTEADPLLVREAEEEWRLSFHAGRARAAAERARARAEASEAAEQRRHERQMAQRRRMFHERELARIAARAQRKKPWPSTSQEDSETSTP
jgi:DNA-binding transcriptional MerR regulator